MFSFQENLAAEDVLLTVEQSTNLVDWETADGSLVLVDQVYIGSGILTSIYSIDPGLRDELYLRV